LKIEGQPKVQRRIEKLKISDIRSGMRRLDIEVKVVEIGEPREVVTRDGTNHRVATALVSDNSGEMNMSLWDEHIDQVKVGDQIRIENGYSTSFRNETQLNVGKYGKLIILGK